MPPPGAVEVRFYEYNPARNWFCPAPDHSYIGARDAKGAAHGFGTWTQDNEIYEGEFENGQRHGSGKLMTSEGVTVQEGNFRRGIFVGATHGRVEYPGGDYYEGCLSASGKPHGDGQLFNPDGTLLSEGNWSNGRQHEPANSILKRTDGCALRGTSLMVCTMGVAARITRTPIRTTGSGREGRNTAMASGDTGTALPMRDNFARVG